MSMTIKCFKYSKKENCTSRPTSSPKHTFNIVLKESTSFNNPTFILDFGGSLPDFNYIYWEELDSYYYVDDIISRTNTVFEIVCSIDALATARPYIIAAESYVKYATNDYNVYLKDDRIIPTTELTTTVTNNLFSDLAGYSKTTSMWILTTFSKTDGLASYAINYNQVEYLTQKLTDDGTAIWGSIKELFGDAKGAIIDLKCIPLTESALQTNNCIADTTSRIYLGDYDTTQDGYRVTSYCYEISDFITFSNPGNFTICEPYTTAKLYMPLIGCIDLALDEFADVSSIAFKYVINIGNGNVSCSLHKGGINTATSKEVATFSGNCAYSVPISFQQIDGTRAITATASLAAGIATGGAFTVAGIAGAAASMTSAFSRTTSTIGSFAGNFAGNDGNRMKLMLYTHGLSDEPENMTELYGRPCGKVMSLESLEGGYVQTVDFHFNSPFDTTLTRAVENYMDSGVYLY